MAFFPAAFIDKIFNKNVVIVFPSRAAQEKENGEFIDGFDCVVRIGNGFKTEGIETSLGKRTDILFHSLRPAVKWQGIEGLDLAGLQNKGVRFVVFKNIGQNHLRKRRIKKYLRKRKIIALPSRKKSFQHLRRVMKMNKIDKKIKTGKSILQGIDAILTILSLEPKNLTIIGKDFYRSGHQENYKTKNIGIKRVKKYANRSHGLHAQKVILLRCLEAYKNISIDKITCAELVRMKDISGELIRLVRSKINPDIQ